MADVFIGNCSSQILLFGYVLPERSIINQTVPILGQIKLTIDCTPPDVEAIWKQWGRYGMLDVTEVGKKEPFSGTIISVGKPIPANLLRYGREWLIDRAVKEGIRIRTEAAIAVSNAMEGQVGVARNFEVSLSEIEPPQGFQNPNETHVAEGVRIDHDAPPGPPRPAAPAAPPGRSRRHR